MSKKEIIDLRIKCLYIRLPIKIKDEQQIKDLHPDIVGVKLRRKDKFRFCHIVFENSEKCAEALKVLKKVKINGKKICIKVPSSVKRGGTLVKADYIQRPNSFGQVH